jgi:RNA polymerase sigma-70 factor (ECF subfamily)
MAHSEGISPGGRDSAAAIGVLVENHRAFLRFLERRVRDRALAEDILQDAFARVADRPELLPPDDALVPWFYRALRNATIDRYRRDAASRRALDALAREFESAEARHAEIEREACACVGRLAGTLKPEYAEVLRAVEVEGQSVKAFAESRGLTASNAGVRLLRARQALKRQVMASCRTCAEHGCLDCSCGSPRTGLA